MLNYSFNDIFQTDLWETLENIDEFEIYQRRKGEGQVRETSKRTVFMRYIKPKNLKTYADSSFPLEVSINYYNPQTGDAVEIICFYNDAKDCMIEISTSSEEQSASIVGGNYRKKFGASKTNRKRISTKAEQAYQIIDRAVRKLESAGFKVVKEEK